MLDLILLAVAAALPDTTRAAEVRVDSSRKEIVVTVSGISIPAGRAYDHHGPDARAYFAWPVRAPARGFRVDVLDSTGRVLPRTALHHAGVANYARRQLAYAMVERLFAAGPETRPVKLPTKYGVPIDSASELGLYFALVNPRDSALSGVTLRATIAYTPERTGAPRTTHLYPLGLGANADYASVRTFDIPPGRSVTTADVVLPIDGWLRGMSAHAHDYAVELRLEDVETGKTLVRIRAERDRHGRLTGLETQTFRWKRRGLELAAGRRYRVVSVYDNPGRDTIPAGAMAFLAGAFAPRDASAWPGIDPRDPVYVADLALLRGERPPISSAHRTHGH